MEGCNLPELVPAEERRSARRGGDRHEGEGIGTKGRDVGATFEERNETNVTRLVGITGTL